MRFFNIGIEVFGVFVSPFVLESFQIFFTLGVGVVPGSLLVVDGGVGALMPVGVVPSALLLMDDIV